MQEFLRALREFGKVPSHRPIIASSRRAFSRRLHCCVRLDEFHLLDQLEPRTFISELWPIDVLKEHLQFSIRKLACKFSILRYIYDTQFFRLGIFRDTEHVIDIPFEVFIHSWFYGFT